MFATSDKRFVVKTDGVLMVSRPVFLHEGHHDFFIHSWDSQGRKLTIPVSVSMCSSIKQNVCLFSQNAADAQVPVLQFPEPGEGLRRRKREWFCCIFVQCHTYDKPRKIYYAITGPGADLPPIGRFTMDRHTGCLYVTQPLDREETAHYTVIILTLYLIITFRNFFFISSTPGTEVVRVEAKDDDEPDNLNSDLRYRILNQDPPLPTDNMFEINPITGSIRVTGRGLDREKYPQYTLTVQAADLAGEELTGQTKVILTVTDSNDNAPVFTQSLYTAIVDENKKDVEVVRMIVTDEDEPQTPAWNAKFKIISGDPDGLFTVKTGTNKQEGILSTAKELDFERASKLTLLISVENEIPFAGVSVVTSTATVVVNVKDVNEDLAVDEVVVQYTASDPDTARKQTVVKLCESETKQIHEHRIINIILNLATELPSGEYDVILRVADKHGLEQDSNITAKVCDWRGAEPTCPDYRVADPSDLPLILGILGAILLLVLLLLVLLFAKQRKKEKKEPLMLNDGVRDYVYYYDEEGGGEDDQDYDLSVLHRGLDNRPDVLRNEVVPNFMPAPQYRPQPANPEEIGNFIEDNLKVADNDPTAPPYDSLLVFDYEGGGSDAGSLSSLNSSSSGDQNYDCLNEWGPRFKKLADMY
uniref:Cadherin-1 n=1 Tax=Oreochromis aureus TaxID=47969 RepID=A0AAZ1Y4F2_OREAU